MMRFGHGGKKEEQIAQIVAKVRAVLRARSVVLVGMPGCGKSAIGRRLAQRLELPFVDADDEIEQAAGKAITDIFKEHGEPYFREGERKVIARILNSGSQVLATGGGAFMSAETRDNIRSSAVSVWLKAELPLLLRRVLKRNNRPLLERDPEGVMRSLVETRYPIYALADITVESRDLPHDVMVFEIIEALAAHGAPRPAETPAAQSTTRPGEPL
jgi:shikimate kinase